VTVRVISDKKVASPPPHMDGSIVFDRSRQCAPPSNTCFLGPAPESIFQTASRSVQPFCTAHGRVSSGMLGHVLSPSNFPVHGAIEIHLIQTRAHNVNGISIGSAVLQGSRS